MKPKAGLHGFMDRCESVLFANIKKKKLKKINNVPTNFHIGRYAMVIMVYAVSCQQVYSLAWYTIVCV